MALSSLQEWFRSLFPRQTSPSERCETTDIETLMKHYEDLSTTGDRCCTEQLLERGNKTRLELFAVLVQVMEDWTSADNYINNLRLIAGCMLTPARKQLLEQCFVHEIEASAMNLVSQQGSDCSSQHEANLKFVKEHLIKRAIESQPVQLHDVNEVREVKKLTDLIENGYSRIISCMQHDRRTPTSHGFNESDVIRLTIHKLSDIIREYINNVNVILTTAEAGVQPPALRQHVMKSCQQSGDGDMYRMLLEATVTNGDCELLRMLLEAPCCGRCDINLRDVTTGDTLLHLAAGFGTVEHNTFDKVLKPCEFKAMLENHVEGTAKFWKSVNKHFIARQDAVRAADYIEIVQLLIDHGADVSSVNNLGETSLHKAASSEWFFYMVFPYLVDHVASTSEPLRSDYTNKHYKVSKYIDDMVDVLVKNNADINAKTLAGYTPLHIAVMTSAKRMQLSRCLYEAIDSATENDMKRTHRRDKMNGGRRGRLIPCVREIIQVSFLVRSYKFCVARAILTCPHADWRIPNNEGDTVFISAVKLRQIRLVEELIRRGADVNDTRISWPEYFVDISRVAICSCNITVSNDFNDYRLEGIRVADDVRSVIRVLHSHGVTLNPTNGRCQTALHIATERCSSTAFNMLLQLRADVNSADNCGRTPLHIAAEHNYCSIVDVIMRVVPSIDFHRFLAIQDEDTLHKYFEQAVKCSCHRYGQIESKPDISKLDDSGQNPLTVAILHNSYETVLAMLTYINDTSGDVVQPSFYADKMKNEICKKFEIQLCGEHLLSHFSAANAVPLINLLLGVGMKINAVNNDQQTALHFAAANGAVDAFNFLLDNGADVNIVDRTGRTALGLAFIKLKGEKSEHDKYNFSHDKLEKYKFSHNKLETMLKHPKCLTDERHVESVMCAKLDLSHEQQFDIEQLLQADKIAYAIDNQGNTLLHKLHSANAIVVDFLIQKGAVVNAQNYDGCTPLHEAFRGSKSSDRYEFANMLLRHGADINMEDGLGNTPLQNAWRVEISDRSTCSVLAEDKHGNCLVKETGTQKLKVNVVCPARGSKDILLHRMLSSKNVATEIQIKDQLDRNGLHNLFKGLSNSDHRSELRKKLDAILDPSTEILNSEIIRKCAKDKDCFGRIPEHYAAMVYDVNNSVPSILDDRKWVDIISTGYRHAVDRFGQSPTDYKRITEVWDKAKSRIVPVKLVRSIETSNCGVWGPFEKLKSLVTPFDKFSIVMTLDDTKSKSSKPYTLDDIIEQWFCKPDTFPKYLISLLPHDVKATDLVWKVWEGLNCHRKHLKAVNKVVTDFMERLVKMIGQEDPRLEGRLWLAGSVFEGAKIGAADEFDFNIELTKFTDSIKACNTSHLAGFYTLQRDESHSTVNELEEFFDDDGQLMSRQLKQTFWRTLMKVLDGGALWSEEKFMEPVSDECKTFYTKLTLRFVKSPIKEESNILEYLFRKISIDVVPVIQHAAPIPPDIASRFAGSNLFDDGCFFILDDPCKLHRVPYDSSAQYVRISYGRAESRMIRDIVPEVVRAAFMVAKYIAGEVVESNVTYVLKTAALWSWSETQNNDPLTPDQLQAHVEALFRKLYEFFIQDYVPMYFMPSIHVPVWKSEKYLGHAHVSLRRMYSIYDEKGIRIEEFVRSLMQCYLMLWDVSDSKPDVAKIFPKLTCSSSLSSTPVTYFREAESIHVLQVAD